MSVVPIARMGGFLSRHRTIRDSVLGAELMKLAEYYCRSPFHAKEPRPPALNAPRVILLNDTFTNYHDPHIGLAALDVLHNLGCHVELANVGCCGRPLISKGMLSQARTLAQANVKRLKSQIEDDPRIVIVGLEPSCISALTDDYLDLVPGEDAKFVADHTMLIEEFIVRVAHDQPSAISNLFHGAGRKLLFHGHCHQKALFGTSAPLQCLRLVGYEVSEIPSGCCGMAGSFGYESEHYDLSMQIGDLVLFPAVRNASPEVEILAAGTSCRHQIEHGTGRKARHPIELLADALTD